MNSSRRAPVRSIKRLPATIAGLVLLSGLGSIPGTAQAQFFYEPDPILPPRAVAWRLTDRGFTQIGRPRFDGRAYVVEASGPYGDRVRLFVDARDGGILGRQRLDAPLPPAQQVRLARPTPGYGWTEDDIAPGRPMREAERLIPPGEIPSAPGIVRHSRPEAATRTDLTLRPEPADRNPLGVNPDARSRPEAPRKVVRLTPPAKPAAPRLTPEAPRPAEVAAPSVPLKQEQPAASLEAPAVAPAAVTPPVTPAAIQPPASATPAAQSSPSAQAWKDPPADAKRPVRVIGGATIVPGAGGKEPGAPDRTE